MRRRRRIAIEILIWEEICVGTRHRFMADSNSLGLDFEKERATEETTAEQETKPEKKKPYVNPERVKTGGSQRVSTALV